MASTAPTNQSPTSPSDKALILDNVVTLATLFSHCVEAFGIIHPAKEAEQAQKIALTKLGIEQGRLLIWGDVVGISSPPPTIAKYMIPSHPGATNPEPTDPIWFGIRDLRLDDVDTKKKVEEALNEIVGRPSHLSREEMMEQYGLKSPKKPTFAIQRALDTNRLEAFREKYGLLQDLSAQGSRGPRRGMSMTLQHWKVKDVAKFEKFVNMVREQVNGLISLMDVKERVDRGMKTDFKAMGWHPDLSGPAVRQDWEKLRFIKDACNEDYPEYVEATEAALKYINEELRESSLSAAMRTVYRAPVPKPYATEKKEKKPANSPRDKGPSFFSRLSFENWGGKKKKDQHRKSIAGPSVPEEPVRSLSDAVGKAESNILEPVRSKSLSAMPEDKAPLSLDSQLATVNSQSSDERTVELEPANTDLLVHADTVNSLIDRHDMYKGVGRIETKDIRNKAHGL